MCTLCSSNSNNNEDSLKTTIRNYSPKKPIENNSKILKKHSKISGHDVPLACATCFILNLKDSQNYIIVAIKCLISEH